MAYNQNIPQPTNRLKDSQADLLANFQAIKQLVDVNHATFGDVNEGKHKFVTMPEQGASPTTAINEMALFTRQSALSSVAELVIRRENNGPAVEFTSSTQATNGWTRLPSGILIKWGTASITSRNSLETIIFPVAGTIPVFTAVFTVQALQTFGAGPSLGQLNTAVSAGNFTTVNFQVFARAIGLPGGTPAVSITYVAIGI